MEYCMGIMPGDYVRKRNSNKRKRIDEELSGLCKQMESLGRKKEVDWEDLMECVNKLHISRPVPVCDLDVEFEKIKIDPVKWHPTVDEYIPASPYPVVPDTPMWDDEVDEEKEMEGYETIDGDDDDSVITLNSYGSKIYRLDKYAIRRNKFLKQTFIHDYFKSFRKRRKFKN